jgi:large subunit ribosomal protein L13
MKKIYDGEGAILGRLGSLVAKDLLKGDEVDVLNCEKIIVSGDKKLFVDKILKKRRMGSGSSLKGPKYPRSADRLVKRMIRGMLPWDRTKGRDAYKRLKVYGVKESEKLKIEGDVIKMDHKMPMKFSEVSEIVRLLK